MFASLRPCIAFLALTAGLIAGCGGSGSATPTAAISTTISGSVVKGPVDGGIVTASTLSGTVLGTTTTSPNGTYSLKITSSGDVVVEVKGGNYVDEATGNSVTLNQLKSIVTLASGTQTVHLTPLTYLAYFYSGNTVAGFNTALTNVATQFGLGSTNLLTSLPTVSGTTTNDYGRVLRAVSQYVATAQRTTPTFNLEQLMGLAGTAGTFNGTLQTAFTTAFNTANPGQSLTFTFNGAGITIAGTGAGGGSGTCGIGVNGNVQGIPVNYNFCVTGLVGQCVAGNISLDTALSGVSVPGVNLLYTYSNSCAAGATPIVIQ